LNVEGKRVERGTRNAEGRLEEGTGEVGRGTSNVELPTLNVEGKRVERGTGNSERGRKIGRRNGRGGTWNIER
jgi:hypothetical protein